MARRFERGRRSVAIAVLAGASVGTIALGRDAAAPPQPLALAAVEVTSDSAVLWGRCARAGSLHVSVGNAPERETVVPAGTDLTATIKVRGLPPGSAHSYRVRCGEGPAQSALLEGGFVTAPAAGATVPVRFAFGGDLGGQNACRDALRGYPIFAKILATKPDFFLALGDMIYADDQCLETGRFSNRQVPGPGPAETRAEFWAHWRYNRDDPGLRELLRRVGSYAVWDDHEVVNDFGPLHDTPVHGSGSSRHLLPEGRLAFLDYNPVHSVEGAGEGLYRSRRWGKHLELFLLDTRRFRDANAAEDRRAEAKTLLGRAQKDWLIRSVAESTATWKVVASSVPLSIPTGRDARDGWADSGTDQGFERELREILRELQRRRVANLLWLTTDVHFSTAFRYRPFADDPRFELHELVTGPLNAGLFPKTDLDLSFGPERLFFHGPQTGSMPQSFDEALGWFNFGLIEVSADGDLRASVIDANGRVRAELRLPRRPAESPES